jgi:hypothetical protein
VKDSFIYNSYNRHEDHVFKKQGSYLIRKKEETDFCNKKEKIENSPTSLHRSMPFLCCSIEKQMSNLI